jgi:PAS domain S-box-containing protein
MNAAEDACLRASWEQAPMGLGVAGLDGRWTRVNARLAALVGASPEAVAAGSIGDLAGPEGRVGVQAQVATRLAQPGPAVTFAATGAAGTRLEVSVAPVRDAAGAATHLSVVVGVRTPRDGAGEAALRASEERLREAQRIARVGSWAYDLGTQTLEWSEQQFRTWEMEPTPTIPVDVAATRVHPDDFEALASAFREAFEDRRHVDTSLRLVMPDGRLKHVRVRGEVRFEGGRRISVMGTTEDVTARVEAEQQLRARERMFATMFDSTSDIVTLLDVASDGTLRVAAVNEAYAVGARAHGVDVTKESAVGLPLTTLHRDFLGSSPEAIAASLARYEAVLRSGATRSYEHHLATPRGELHTENVIVPIFDEGGRVVRLLLTSRDITARKQAEEALARHSADLEQRVAERTSALSVANAALERASRTKDEFLASMSHELRTPLNAVLGLTEALQEGVYGPLGEAQQRALRRIEESGRLLLALLSDILDLAKIEAGREGLDLGEVLVDDVCRASLRLVQTAASKRRQRISLRVTNGFGVLRADPRRLTQILVNLLSNAVKFTPEEGEVGLEASWEEDEAVVRFTVWDTGVGIALADQARLFLPFVQLDSSLSRQHQGTGLGLALVRKLVELHGGGVSLESEPGKGSRFSVLLPVQRAPSRAPSSPPPPASAAAPRGARILLAEDDETNVATVLDFLESCGYDVRVARNGAEAVALVEELRPDVVLMDVQMPVLDGLAAMRRIRAHASPELRAVPIISVTALAMAHDRERCLAAGADAYLTKPVSLKRLVGAIEEQLARRPARPHAGAT